MPGGFALPWVVFLGSLWAPERAYLRTVLSALPERYQRLVEPAADSFAVSLVARDLGWAPERCECSDVSLYSAVVGGAICGRDMAELGVCVDGEPVTFEGSPTHQAAEALALQVRLRIAARIAKKPTDYMASIADDLEARHSDHVAELEKRIGLLVSRLGGFSYESRDLVEHTIEAAARPDTIVVSASPTYKAGYEKFFDTGGRLSWDEPTYGIFDPADGTAVLLDAVADAPGLVLCIQECEPRKSAAPPVYARQAGPGDAIYWLSNRPEEVLALTGGVRVAPRNPPALEPTERPPLPPEHEITASSVIAVEPIPAMAAAYLKELWAHRIIPKPAGRNFAVIVDGYIAGIGGLDVMLDLLRDASKAWPGHVLHTYGFAPFHPQRLTRLISMLALQRGTLERMATPTTALWYAGATDVLTVIMGPHPESKAMRGIMRLVERRPEGDGWRLFYTAPVGTLSAEEVLAEWLRKETNWQRQRARASALTSSPESA